VHAQLEELLAILDQELAYYRCLYDLLRESQRLILECRAEELGKATAIQEDLLATLRMLERERTYRVDDLGERLGLPPDERTTTGLAAYMAPAYGERMLSVARELLPLLERIGHLNAENAFHLQHSCEYLELSLHMIASARAPKNPQLYGRKGMVNAYGRGPATVSVNRTA
jgi:flagellar biosynthesis/type III secretory pathway chaperone